MTDYLPGIGELTVNDDGLPATPALHVTLLGKEVPFTIFDYDPQQTDKIVECIENFRTLPAEALHQATNAAFAYYQDVYQDILDEYTMEWLPIIKEPAKVWDHIQLDQHPGIHSGGSGDDAWYVVFECECDWEPEHGLTMIFRSGTEIIKVGPYDGFLTWHEGYRDASGDGLYRVP